MLPGWSWAPGPGYLLRLQRPPGTQEMEAGVELPCFSETRNMFRRMRVSVWLWAPQNGLEGRDGTLLGRPRPWEPGPLGEGGPLPWTHSSSGLEALRPLLMEGLRSLQEGARASWIVGKQRHLCLFPSEDQIPWLGVYIVFLGVYRSPPPVRGWAIFMAGRGQVGRAVSHLPGTRHPPCPPNPI